MYIYILKVKGYDLDLDLDFGAEIKLRKVVSEQNARFWKSCKLNMVLVKLGRFIGGTVTGNGRAHFVLVNYIFAQSGGFSVKL